MVYLFAFAVGWTEGAPERRVARPRPQQGTSGRCHTETIVEPGEEPPVGFATGPPKFLCNYIYNGKCSC